MLWNGRGIWKLRALPRRDVQGDTGERGEAAKVLGEVLYLEKRRVHFLNNPTTPSGANTTNSTSSTPTTSTLISLEMVTVTICWIEPSSSAPITGPIQCPVPPIIGIASALTPQLRLKLEAGSMN